MTVARQIPATKTTYTADFRRGSRTSRGKGRIPRVARLLALAHKIDGLIRAGEIRDLADAARLAGLTRGRMTQIANLLLLAPEIHETILDMPRVLTGRDSICERDLRPIATEHLWEQQIAIWRQLTAARFQGEISHRAD